MNAMKQMQTVSDCRNILGAVNIRVICIDPCNRIPNKNGNILYIWKVADSTGSINLCVWDKLGEAIQVGDILVIQNGYTNKYNNCMHLYTSQKGRIYKTDEFCMPFMELPNISSLMPPDVDPQQPPMSMRPPPN